MLKIPWNSLAILGLIILAVIFAVHTGHQPLNTSEIRAVSLDPGDAAIFPVLKEPDAKSLRSTLVTLAPGKSAGIYNTGTSEEMIVPLEGQGEVRLADHPPVAIKPGLVTYAPAHTEHNVFNTGSTRFRYLVVMAKAE